MKSLLILLVLTFGVVQTTADRKMCFCKAVDADNPNNVFHDFGAVEEHSHWLSVRCSRLNGCADKCDRTVQDWLCQSKDACRSLAQGKQVRHYYQASVCSEAAGSLARPCGCVGAGFDNIPKCQFECMSQSNVAAFINCFNTCFSG